MKIAITGPHYWPYRRRGSAAYIYNLSKYLASQGHEVEIITAKPGKSRRVRKGNVSITYHGYLQHPLLEQYNVDRVHTFPVSCFTHFLKTHYDIIHCMYHPDGFAASLSKRFTKLRYVYLVTTTPFDFHWKHSPIDPYMFKRAFSGADRCIVPSRYAQECMKRDYQIAGEQIPCGVDLDHFRPVGQKDRTSPRILCAASLRDERKGLPLLVKAFERLLQEGTKAILQLTGETDAETNRHLLSLVEPEVRRYIEILPAVTFDQLPHIYSSAAMTVLPSISETFGMNLTESLACGTPIVGTRSGAIPEIINDPSIGRLFDLRDGGNTEDSVVNLFHALKETLALAKEPDIVDRCREASRQYDWRKVGKEIEAIYTHVLNGNS